MGGICRNDFWTAFAYKNMLRVVYNTLAHQDTRAEYICVCGYDRGQSARVLDF